MPRLFGSAKDAIKPQRTRRRGGDVDVPAAPAEGRSFWQRALGGSEIGQAIRVDGRAVTVVGVMPDGFDFPEGTDVWIPREQLERNPHRTGHNWLVVARLASGMPLNAARSDATAAG